MTSFLAEVSCALRRMARRRSGAGALAAAAALLVFAGLVRPVATARDALSAATAIATVTLLVVTAGIVGDDVERGRLALAATHPAPPLAWVGGRWLAALAASAAVFAAAAAALLPVACGLRPPPGVVAGAAVSLLHLAALAALAVALSCRLGSTAQLLVLLALLVAGAVPPEIVGLPAGPLAAAAARAAWSALPTSWALGELHRWALGGAAGSPAPQPLLALVLGLQPALWLAAGASRLGSAELAERRG